jgi:hypothetical protein
LRVEGLQFGVRTHAEVRSGPLHEGDWLTKNSGFGVGGMELRVWGRVCWVRVKD